MKEIKNEATYKDVMAEIDRLMAKGSKQVSEKELEKIRELAQSAQSYEHRKYIIEPPSTFVEMI